MNRNSILLPGATIGILGSGQLGRMLALAARRLGYRVLTLSPEKDSPTGQVADREFVAEYDDAAALSTFAQSVDVVTFEFENVSAEATALAEQFAPVRPHGSVLHTTQQRLREKNFLRENGFPVTMFTPVRAEEDLDHGPYPAILKTAGFGYDGKGQRRVRNRAEAREAFVALGRQECILEGLVDFACEVSVVAARGIDGSFAAYPAVRNDHARHILDITLAPAPEAAVPAPLQHEAHQIARGILEALDVVGVLCVEMFVTADGKLLVNELAPRPHNSGHWTIEGCPVSQFEQQLRAICGLPLGETLPRRPAAMVNLLGDIWETAQDAGLTVPNWSAALAMPDTYLHLYGKREARAGRKMGHITVLADTTEEAAARAIAARNALWRSIG